MRKDSLLRHPGFRKLFAADAGSQLGTFVGTTAVPLLAALTLAATPFQMGLLTMSENLAFLLIGLPAGVWVDRMRRRRVMLTADFTRAALVLSVPVAWWLGVLTLWQVLAVALLTGVATVFFDLSYQSYLPALVGRDHLVEGNAKLQGLQSAAQIGGPSLAGGLVQWISAANTVLLTGIGYLSSALCLLSIRADEPVARRAHRDRLLPQIAEGLKFVFGNRTLTAIVCATSTANFFGGAFDAVRVLFLTRTAGLPPAAIGALFTAGGIGGITAALCAGPLIRRIGQARAIWLIPLCTWPADLLVPFAGPDWRVALAALGLVIAGFGVVGYNIAQVSYRQAICPDRLLGRMNASVRFVVWGTLPLGGLAGGALGEWLGLRDAGFVAAAGLGLACLWVVCSPLRRMRDLPTAPEEKDLAPA